MRRLPALAYAFCGSLMSVFPADIARGWWSTGHELVGQIAQNHISAPAKSAVESLLRIPVAYPGDLDLSLRTQTIVTVAPWADSIKTLTWRSEAQEDFFSGLHFLDSPIHPNDPLSIPVAARALDQGLADAPGANIVYAIKSAIKVLAAGRSDDTSALALRFLIHFAGDVHQPLHCADPIVNDESTHGGNDLPLLSSLYVPSVDSFAVEVLGNSYDLADEFHTLWDAAGGAFTQLLDASQAGSERDLPIVEKLALEIEATHAGRFVADIQDPSIDDWAVGSVYQGMVAFREQALAQGAPACTGTTCYAVNLGVQEQAADVSRDRIYVGGQRLAQLLNALYDPIAARQAYIAYVAAVAADPDVSDIYAQLVAPE